MSLPEAKNELGTSRFKAFFRSRSQSLKSNEVKEENPRIVVHPNDRRIGANVGPQGKQLPIAAPYISLPESVLMRSSMDERPTSSIWIRGFRWNFHDTRVHETALLMAHIVSVLIPDLVSEDPAFFDMLMYNLMPGTSARECDASSSMLGSQQTPSQKKAVWERKFFSLETKTSMDSEPMECEEKASFAGDAALKDACRCSLKHEPSLESFRRTLGFARTPARTTGYSSSWLGGDPFSPSFLSDTVGLASFAKSSISPQSTLSLASSRDSNKLNTLSQPNSRQSSPFHVVSSSTVRPFLWEARSMMAIPSNFVPTDMPRPVSGNSYAFSLDRCLVTRSPPPLKHFAFKIFRQLGLSSLNLFLALQYIHRLRKRCPGIDMAHRSSEYRVFVASLMLASKYLDDRTFTNRTWAGITDTPIAEINEMEADFLKMINFDLGIQPDTLKVWIQVIERIALDRSGSHSPSS